MKRLFQITLANGKPYTSVQGTQNAKYVPYYDDKQDAKEIRDIINANEHIPAKLKPARVSPGPDHWRYTS